MSADCIKLYNLPVCNLADWLRQRERESLFRERVVSLEILSLAERITAKERASLVDHGNVHSVNVSNLIWRT